MCFSATASFTAAGLVGATGMATLPLARGAREAPLALFGVAFAAHQALEGLVWVQLGQAGTTTLRSPAVAVWLVFAWALLPLWVPVALALVEPDDRRRRLMTVLAGCGATVGLVLGTASFLAAVHARVVASHLSYVVPAGPAKLAIVPYVIVTCGPPLLSSHRSLQTWGVALAVSMGLTAWLQQAGFASIWCFFAAGLSALLLVHFVRLRRTSYEPKIDLSSTS